MSALEQIRQRPILIISILGLALLLFILTAVDNPGELFSDNHTVAKVDGQKIDYMEFQRRVEQQSEQMRAQGYTDIDNARLQQQVLQSMINEVLLNEEYKALGLTVTDNELSNAMLGENPNPIVTQMVQQMGLPSAKEFYDYAFNPTKYGMEPAQAQQLQQAWQSLEKDTEQMLMQQKFATLFQGVIQANKLDAKAYYDDNAETRTIAYVRKDLSTLDDKDFTPSEKEIDAVYKEQKERFKINEKQYVVSYFSVDVTPSDADRAAARAEVDKAIAALRTTPGTEAVANNAAFYVDRASTTRSRLAPLLRNNLEKIVADTVYTVSSMSDKIVVAKYLGQTTGIDSVLVDLAVLAEGAAADSVTARLNAGAKPADLGEQLIAQSQDSVWLAITDPQAAMLKDELSTVATGSYFVPQNNPGVAIKVRTRKAPVTLYDIAQISYDIEPSATTVNALNKKLTDFLAANNTAAKFKEAAPKAGYALMEGVVTPSTLQVGNLNESRNACKWAISNKKGDVSGILRNDTDTRLMAVALDDIFDGDYIPSSYKPVNDYLTGIARNRMKADKLMAEYKDKASNLAGYAAAMKASVDTTQVTFGQLMVRDFPFGESKLSANVAVAPQGKLVGPVALNSSVVVFQVNNIEKSGRPFDQENDAMMFNRSQGAGAMQQNISAILLGNKKIDNRIQKFYSDRQD